MDTVQLRFEPLPQEPMTARALTPGPVQLRGETQVGGQRLSDNPVRTSANSL